jgi:carboxyl-terminal processing protease
MKSNLKILKSQLVYLLVFCFFIIAGVANAQKISSGQKDAEKRKSQNNTELNIKNDKTNNRIEKEDKNNIFIIDENNDNPGDITELSDKFSSALKIINSSYVDTVNESKLVETAIKKMLEDLDPHSVYISAAELKEANEPLEGNFEGIGVQFQIMRDSIEVVATIAGGPSEKVGVMPGDKIIKIDNENSTGKKITNDYVLKKLRGKKNTKVNIVVYRRSVNELLDFTITRDVIPIKSIDAYFMATENIGYIKLDRFAQTSMKEFNKAISELKNNGMKSLILDLRGNSGGYLNTAIDLADEFLPKGKLIVYTEGVHSTRIDYKDKYLGSFENGKLVVLIDEGSASASEIVAGAIQDWDRGLIIGRLSFGKGLVQRPYDLPDGSVIRLTTARYHTPTGRCIQRPYVDGIDKYYEDLEDRYSNGSLINPDSLHFPDSLKYYTSKKRVVYGGGGIMPDIFIPLDTTEITKYYSSLIRKGVLNQFALQYVDDNRKKLKEQFSSLELYVKNYIVEENLVKLLVEYAEKEGIKKDDNALEISKNLIKRDLKGLIARNLWDTGAYIQIYMQTDKAYLKAIDAINDPTTFKKNKIKE